MLYHAYGARVDSVGKIDIRDNVFIGHGAIILHGVTIGPNAVVAAGALVNQDVLPGTIVGGARPSKLEKLMSYWVSWKKAPGNFLGLI